LQCVAVYCSMSHLVAVCVAVCCSGIKVLPPTHTLHKTKTKDMRVVVCCRVLQGVAVWCSMLQCCAVCCSVLQCVAAASRPPPPRTHFPHPSPLERALGGTLLRVLSLSVLQCVAVCCSVCVATCSVLQCAVCCILQHTATHSCTCFLSMCCSVLLCVAVFVLQCAVSCILQHTATHSCAYFLSVCRCLLMCVAVRVLQCCSAHVMHIATHCNILFHQLSPSLAFIAQISIGE